MRTTITLDPDVFKQLNKKIKELDLTFKDAVNNFLRKGLREDSGKKTKAKIALPNPKKLKMDPDLSCENVWKLLEEIEG